VGSPAIAVTRRSGAPAPDGTEAPAAGRVTRSSTDARRSVRRQHGTGAIGGRQPSGQNETSRRGDAAGLTRLAGVTD
jgi:hypothetical protein